MILHLGVVDVPYVAKPSSWQTKPTSGTVTTGDVAGWLENRYHVMEIFYEEKQADIAGDLELSVSGAIESFIMGAPAQLDPFGGATSKIEDRFKQFLSQGEIERLSYPGIPTQASLDRRAGKGRSSRFKRKGKTSKTGPSFIDTGLYQASFKSWID